MSIAAIAGTTAAAAYLDAKFHFRKDINTLYNKFQVGRQYARAVAENRQSLWYPFEEEVARLPADEECLWSRTSRYTWQEAHAHACRYGQFYLELGVRPGELVAFDLTNSAEFMLAWLGLWSVGAAPAMMNHNLGGEALVHCLRTCGARVVVVDEDAEVRGRVEAVREKIEGELGMRIVVLDAQTKAGIMAREPIRPGDELRANVKGPDTAFMVYTSGTTGFPKAVAFTTTRTWEGVRRSVRQLGILPGPNGGRWYNPMPLYHGTGGNTAVFCLTSGVTLCVGKKFSASGFWDEVRASGSTAFVYVGETARYLLAAPPSPRDREHKVTMMFGNGLRPDVWRRFQERFGVEIVSEFFNSSEGVFGLLNVSRGDFLATAVGHHGLILRTLLRNTFVPVEVDPATNDILRLPATNRGVRPDYTTGGEMLVRVPSEALSGFAGYHNNPGATSKKFAKGVFEDGDVFFRSGDALRRDGDGRWFFMDRLGDTFRWKSENVSTAEVAVACGEFPGVVEANVYGVLVPGHDGRAGCAALYIKPEERAGFDFVAFGRALRERLPRYAVPVFLRLVGEVSPMHNQKQNKVPLREEGVDFGKMKGGDRVFWWRPGGEGYVEFTPGDWEDLVRERAKL